MRKNINSIVLFGLLVLFSFATVAHNYDKKSTLPDVKAAIESSYLDIRQI